MSNLRAKPLAVAITAAFAATNGQGATIADGEALFESRILARTVLADAHGGEGNCGEGKCGSEGLDETSEGGAPSKSCGDDAKDGYVREPETGKTELHLAVESGNPEAVMVLVQAFGKDLVKATDNECKVPRDYLRKNAKGIAKVLDSA